MARVLYRSDGFAGDGIFVKSGQILPLKMCFFRSPRTSFPPRTVMVFPVPRLTQVVQQEGDPLDVVEVGVGEEDVPQDALLPDVQGDGDRPRVQQQLSVHEERGAVVAGNLGARGAQDLDHHPEIPPFPHLH